jgi:hypothetical protein
MSEKPEVPPKPSRLLLWMDKNGTPSQLRVEYRPTGVDTAETWIVLSVIGERGIVTASVDIHPGELARDTYGNEPGQDVCLRLDHAFCVRPTENGRKRLDAWKAFQKREAADISEFARLKEKFGKTDPRQ